jgi:KaiC
LVRGRAPRRRGIGRRTDRRHDRKSEDDTKETEENVESPDAPVTETNAPGTEPVTDTSAESADTTTTDESDADDAPLFDDDFASAFASAPGGSGDGEPDFGGGGGFDAAEFDSGGFNSGGFDGVVESGGFGGAGGGSFDDETFDSAIPRIDIGIAGLDSMIQGGIPERTLLVVIGSAGTGNTTFGLQFVNYPTLLPRRICVSVLEGGALMWTPGNQSPAIGR